MATHHASEHHVSDVGTYVKIYFALLGLTFLTVALMWVNLSPFNAFMAMVVATVKAYLVVMYFMHQKYETKINRIVFFGSVVFLAILTFFCVIDIWTRVTFKDQRDFTKPVNVEGAATSGEAAAPEAAAPTGH
jgi:cytochrome c oxidase subunit 4